MDKKTRDLFVKIKPIFKKDIILYKNSFIMAGDLSKKEISGEYLIEIDDKYTDSLDLLFDKEKVYYIKDVVEFKDIENPLDYMESLDEITNKKELEKIEKYISHINEQFSIDCVWKRITDIGDNIVDDLFNKRSIYNIKYNKDNVVSIGKPLLPSVTEKLIDELYLYIDTTNDSLGKLLLDFHHTHFRLYMIYAFIYYSMNDF